MFYEQTDQAFIAIVDRSMEWCSARIIGYVHVCPVCEQGPGERGGKPDLLEKWGPNRLRHSAATDIRRHFGLEAAQVALGHAQADVTQVYAERDLRLAAEVAREH